MHARFRGPRPPRRVRPPRGARRAAAAALAIASLVASAPPVHGEADADVERPPLSEPRPPPRAATATLDVQASLPGTVEGLADALRVRRTRLPAGLALPTLGVGPWRYDFELTLGRDGTDLVLVDGVGATRRFAPRASLADGRFEYAAIDGSGARVVGTGAHHALHYADGTVTLFREGRPVRSERADGSAARWHEARGRLVGHDDGRGRTLRFEYDARGRLVRLHGAQATIELDDPAGSDDAPASPGPPAAFGECPVDAPCDGSTHPPPAGFANGAGIPGAVRRDLRPGTCRSHFVERTGTRRGLAIERGLALLPGTGLGAPTVHAFPVADFVGTREITVVRSRDLASPTYADGTSDTLFDRLVRDGDDIERLLLRPLAERGHVGVAAPPAERGIRRIESGPERVVVLELVVRHAMAGPGHVDQIERARAALAARGIELRVVEIP